LALLDPGTGNGFKDGGALGGLALTQNLLSGARQPLGHGLAQAEGQLLQGGGNGDVSDARLLGGAAGGQIEAERLGQVETDVRKIAAAVNAPPPIFILDKGNFLLQLQSVTIDGGAVHVQPSGQLDVAICSLEVQ